MDSALGRGFTIGEDGGSPARGIQAYSLKERSPRKGENLLKKESLSSIESKKVRN